MIISSFLVIGCQSNQQTDKNNPAASAQPDSVELSEGWARPGTEGGNSAAYLAIENNTSQPDTLREVSVDVAAKAEVHESFEEDGLSGMRPAGPIAIAAGSTLKLQPGGLHVMLMNLSNGLAEGDSVELELHFSKKRIKRVAVPVKISD